jgi:hypothetical protein
MIWMIGTVSRHVVQEAWETILCASQFTDDQINGRLENFDPEFIMTPVRSVGRTLQSSRNCGLA